jgi:hypothetical protein
MSKSDSRTWTVTARNPRAPACAPKNPSVILDVVVDGEWSTTVMLQHLRRAGLIMRMPTAPEGGPGVTVPPGLWQAMADAALDAVKQAPELHATLFGPHPVSGAKRTPLVVRPAPPVGRGP